MQELCESAWELRVGDPEAALEQAISLRELVADGDAHQRGRIRLLEGS